MNPKPLDSYIKGQVIRLMEIHRSIQALCNNPYWTAERKWRIDKLSREADAICEQILLTTKL